MEELRHLMLAEGFGPMTVKEYLTDVVPPDQRPSHLPTQIHQEILLQL